MTKDSTAPAGHPGGTEPVSGCLVRLGWMVGGIVPLLALSMAIGQEPPWTLTTKDIVFWVIVGAVVALRYIDVTHFKGRTSEGRPATLRDVVRYAMGLVVASALVWTLAQSIEMPI